MMVTLADTHKIDNQASSLYFILKEGDRMSTIPVRVKRSSLASSGIFTS